MTSLLTDWIRTLIDSELRPVCFQLQNPSSTTPAFLNHHTWHPPSGYDDSQPPYHVRRSFDPRQSLIRLSVKFDSDNLEALQVHQRTAHSPPRHVLRLRQTGQQTDKQPTAQLLSELATNRRLNYAVSDGTTSISAHFPERAKANLRQTEGRAFDKLHSGCIFQVNKLTFHFSLKTKSDQLQTLKTRLIVEDFNTVAIEQPLQGNPQRVDKLSIFHQLKQDWLKFEARYPNYSLASPHTPKQARYQPKPAHSKSLQNYQLGLLDTPSKRLSVSQKGDHTVVDSRLLSPECHSQILDPSAPTSDTKSDMASKASIDKILNFDSKSLNNWATLPPISRRLCVVPPDQIEVLSSEKAWLPYSQAARQLIPNLPSTIIEVIHQAQMRAESIADSMPTHPPSTQSQTKVSETIYSQNATSFKKVSTFKNHQDQDNEQASEIAAEDDAASEISWEATPQAPKRLNVLPTDSPDIPSSAHSTRMPRNNGSLNSPPKYCKSLEEGFSDRRTPLAILDKDGVNMLQSQQEGRPDAGLETQTNLRRAFDQNVEPLSQQTGSDSEGSRRSSVLIPGTQQSQLASDAMNTANAKRKQATSEISNVKRHKLANQPFRSNYGFSQETPVSQDPAAVVSHKKREFLNQLNASKEKPQATPTSSKVPATQLIENLATSGVRPSHERQNSLSSVEPASRPPSVSRGSPGLGLPNSRSQSVRATPGPEAFKRLASRASTPLGSTRPLSRTGLQEGVVPRTFFNPTPATPADSIYNEFMNAYVDYRGTKNHFKNLCARLLETQLPCFVYDDFVVRHKTEYSPLLASWAELGKDLSYNAWYENLSEQPKYPKSILNKEKLKVVSESKNFR